MGDWYIIDITIKEHFKNEWDLNNADMKWNIFI